MTNFLLVLILIALLGGGAFLVSSVEIIAYSALAFIKALPTIIGATLVITLFFLIFDLITKKHKKVPPVDSDSNKNP